MNLYNPLRFRILQKEYKKLITTIDDKNRDEKLQYDINRKTSKISALSSGKIDKYEYLTGKEVLLSDQRRIIDQAMFKCSSLGKSLKNKQKQMKNKDKSMLKL